MSTLSFGERFARSAWRATPQRALSELIGLGARCAIPSAIRVPFLTSFARRYGIAVEEAEKSIDQYCGLQEFFTRRLKPGARPIDSTPRAIVSSADGTVVEAGEITAGKLLEAKGGAFDLATLVADDGLAAAFDGGSYLVTYLSPRDYHRVHSPIAGRITAWHHVPGKLFPVNDASVRREPGLFAKNERFTTVIESEAGLAAVVMVAAVGVGHITSSFDPDVETHARAFARRGVAHKRFEPGLPIERGGELGIFGLGSTTILLFQRGRVQLDALTPATSVRMGVAVGRVVGQSGGVG